MAMLKKTDVAIVGGGLGGSLASAMLRKSGIDHVLIDPREAYPDEFRCEKFDAGQIDLLEQTGVAGGLFEAITPVCDVWMARFGRLLRKQSYPHYGFSYATAVNALRSQPDAASHFLVGRVSGITTSPDRQLVKLSDGGQIDARLVVLASGAHAGLHAQLGFSRAMLSERHCLAIGFDVAPGAADDFEFDTMTYWPEKASGKMSYLTVFRSGEGWRANLFGYWHMRDPIIQALKTEPENVLRTLMPGLEKISGTLQIPGKVRVRPIDLYQWENLRCDGVVAIGDACSSSCPGAGTGTTKVINDVLQLCGRHVPEWLASEGMDADKLASYRDDAEKQRVDLQSQSEAYRLRSLTLDISLYWGVQRGLRYVYHGLRGQLARG